MWELIKKPTEGIRIFESRSVGYW